MAEEKQQSGRAVRPSPDRTEYQQRYYLSRREEIAEARRRRYQEDAAYRQAVMAASAASKQRHARALQAARAAKRVVAEVAPGMIVEGPQGPMRGYFLGAMGMVLGMTRDGVRWWRTRGILPPSPYRCRGGYEVYSEAQIAGVAAARERHWERYPQKDGRIVHGEHLRALIEAQWRAIGAVGADQGDPSCAAG